MPFWGEKVLRAASTSGQPGLRNGGGIAPNDLRNKAPSDTGTTQGDTKVHASNVGEQAETIALCRLRGELSGSGGAGPAALGGFTPRGDGNVTPQVGSPLLPMSVIDDRLAGQDSACHPSGPQVRAGPPCTTRTRRSTRRHGEANPLARLAPRTVTMIRNAQSEGRSALCPNRVLTCRDMKWRVVTLGNGPRSVRPLIAADRLETSHTWRTPARRLHGLSPP